MSLATPTTDAGPQEKGQSVDLLPEDRAAYMTALLDRVATIDGGAALALVLRSILAELGHLHDFADDTTEFVNGASETLASIGKGGIGGMLGLLRGQ